MPRELKPFDRHEIAKVSITLRRLGAETERLAKAMEEEGFDQQLQVDSGDNMRKGLKDIAMWLAKIQGAYLQADMPPAKDEPTTKPKAKK